MELFVIWYYRYYVSGHYPSSCFYLKHRPVYISKQCFDTRFYLRLQVKPTLLGPIDTASPCLLQIGTGSGQSITEHSL
jgi:hypothetical protein